MSLFLFDIDGTLVRSFMREGGGGASQAYDLVEVLPGRLELLTKLRDERHYIALVTNQGGVAFGYQDLPQVFAKLAAVQNALGLVPGLVCEGERSYRDAAGFPVAVPDGARPSVYVAFNHPHARLDRYRCADDWRKPGGRMIRQATLDYNVSRSDVVFVGDMETDRQAAASGGSAYVDVDDFFGECASDSEARRGSGS